MPQPSHTDLDRRCLGSRTRSIPLFRTDAEGWQGSKRTTILWDLMPILPPRLAMDFMAQVRDRGWVQRHPSLGRGHILRGPVA